MELIANQVVAMFRFDEYLIEICREEDCWFSYLQKENYNIKMGMFGVPFDRSLEGFVDLVESDIEEYIELYEKEGYGS